MESEKLKEEKFDTLRNERLVPGSRQQKKEEKISSSAPKQRDNNNNGNWNGAPRVASSSGRQTNLTEFGTDFADIALETNNLHRKFRSYHRHVQRYRNHLQWGTDPLW